MLDAEQLAARLEGVKYQYEQAAAFQYDAERAGRLQPGPMRCSTLLILLLVGEQILAWSASYHPPSPTRHRGRRRCA